MTAGWLVYALVTGALLAVVCRAGEGLCRERRIATRWIWGAGLVVVAILSARSLIAARAPVETVPLSAMTTNLALTSASPGHSPVIRLLLATVDAGSTALRDAMMRATQALPRWIAPSAAMLWLATSCLAFAAIVLVHLRIARLRRRWPSTRLHGHDVRIAPAVGPAVLGVLQPYIVVPRWLLARTDDEQRLVLAHEREHLGARDHLLLTGAWVVVALVPWHPAVWWLLARLRLAIELDCDARVLRQGIAPRTYGTLLIDLAGQCAGFTMGATALADEASHLERRLLAMKPIASRHARLRASALAATGLLALLAACEARIPTSADVRDMDVASAEKSATGAGLLVEGADANTIYYVDGVKTDAGAARTLAASAIASIEVRKTNGASEIRIATHGKGTGASTPSGSREVQFVPHVADARAFAGVLIIDGVVTDVSKLKTLDPASIASVEVIKGARAMELSSDPAAVNGIIKVTTKQK